MKKSNFLFMLLGAGFLLLMLFGLRPVPPLSEKNAQKVEGVILSIEEGAGKDICFRLKGGQKTFYINRGLERGLSIDDLKKELLDQAVTIIYPEYFALLDPVGNTRHLSQLFAGNKLLFDETNGLLLSNVD